MENIEEKSRSLTNSIPDQKTPVKFILLGKYRVGSNLLTRSLQNHSEIAMYGELFNISEINKHPKRLFEPDKFINDFFKNINYGKKAKGFKLMYNQLSLQDFEKSSWPDYTPIRIINNIEEVNKKISDEAKTRIVNTNKYLFTNPEIKIIHIKRKNLLDQLISTKRAFSEDNWHSKEYRIKKLILSKEECYEFFERTKSEQEEYDLKTKNKPVLQIYYEDLINNHKNTMNNVFKFLNVKFENLQSNLKKQSSHTKEEIIVNYKELKEEFLDSQWEQFF